MKVSEIFGHGVDNHTDIAWNNREQKLCPFKGSQCTKSSKRNPIGVCSVSDGHEAASLCPSRFLEGGRLFTDAARIAFGASSQFAIFPEIRILQVPNPKREGTSKKIGKVDYVLGKVECGKITDFCAVEVQAAYFSGTQIRSLLAHFLEHRDFGAHDTFRRPDFRSCAQKRLIPQLHLKVPVFRRWGKKFFVVVDRQFFRSLPQFPSVTSANSELTWLVYPLGKEGDNFCMSDPQIAFSEWDDVANSLREGKAPDPSEVILELQSKLTSRKAPLAIFDC